MLDRRLSSFTILDKFCSLAVGDHVITQKAVSGHFYKWADAFFAQQITYYSLLLGGGETEP